VRSDEHGASQVQLLGVGGAGPWVAAARAVAGDSVARAAIDTQGFRFAGIRSYRDVQFWPGTVKYGDLPALLALSAPGKLWIAGEAGRLPPIVEAAYRAAGRREEVISFDGTAAAALEPAIEWLLEDA
jgi:hypothetical protein